MCNHVDSVWLCLRSFIFQSSFKSFFDASLRTLSYSLLCKCHVQNSNVLGMSSLLSSEDLLWSSVWERRQSLNRAQPCDKELVMLISIHQPFSLFRCLLLFILHLSSTDFIYRMLFKKRTHISCSLICGQLKVCALLSVSRVNTIQSYWDTVNVSLSSNRCWL